MDAEGGVHGNCGTILAAVTTHHQPNSQHHPCRQGQRGGKEGIMAIHKGPQQARTEISSQAQAMVHRKGGLAEKCSGTLTSGVTWEQK